MGDWVYLRSLGLAALVVGVDVGPDPDTLALSLAHDEVGHFENENRTLIPLFTLRQLCQMLEERGYEDWELFARAREESGVWRAGYYTLLWIKDKDGEPKEMCIFGPDPCCAMLRAWLSLQDSEEEVVKDV